MSRRGLLCQLDAGERFFVDTDRFEIGRSRQADLCVHDGTVSKRHVLIARIDGRWLVSDLQSTSGIAIRGARVGRPTQVVAGDEFRFGSHHVRILDVDYEAADDELWRGFHRTVRLTCPRLVCRGDLMLSAMTSSAKLESALAAMLARMGAALHSNAYHFEEPVELLLALERFVDETPGSLQLKVHDLVIASSALELLADDSVPARAAWAWLMRTDETKVARHQLRGIAFRGDFRLLPKKRDELVATLDPSERGLIAWVVQSNGGYLLCIDDRATLELQENAVRHAVTIERTPIGWLVHHRGTSKSIEAGGVIDLGYNSKLEVIATR